ncbi:MAG: glycosyltransferase family 2 protein [Bacteroidales bacterium]
MVSPKQIYSGQDLAFIIPTKDRPIKIRAVLDSIVQQTIKCGRILVIDGGQSVKEIVMSFSCTLPVEYYACHPPGQIRQKKMGINLLDDRTPLVGFLDDDIVLEPQAIERLLSFWNKCEPEAAGVSFNIINGAPQPKSWLRNFFDLSVAEPGRVLRSGMATSNCQVTHNIRAQWVCGGATIWKQQILKDFPYREIASRWAITEDLIYSYPIGKRFPLYVCADAKVRHEHVIDYVAKMKHFYCGYTYTIWCFYFVESNPEFSRMFFLLTMLMGIVSRLIIGIFTFQMRHLEFSLGQLKGVIMGLVAISRAQDLSVLLNEVANAQQ